MQRLVVGIDTEVVAQHRAGLEQDKHSCPPRVAVVAAVGLSHSSCIAVVVVPFAGIQVPREAEAAERKNQPVDRRLGDFAAVAQQEAAQSSANKPQDTVALVEFVEVT